MRDWPPGPAGSVGLQLTEGLHLEADYADPAALVDLTVEPLLGSGRPRVPRHLDVAVRSLLGESAGPAFDAMAELGSGAKPRLIGWSEGSSRLHAALGRLAVLVDLLDVEPDQLRRALAALESAGLAAQLDPRLGLRQAARAWAVIGVGGLAEAVGEGTRLPRQVWQQLLTEVAPALWELLGEEDEELRRALRLVLSEPSAAAAVDTVVRSPGSQGGEQGPDLSEARALWKPVTDGYGPVVAPPSSWWLPSGGVDLAVPLEVTLHPDGQPATEVRVTARRAPRAGTGKVVWARLSTVPRMVPMAIAPLRPAGGAEGLTGRLFFPPQGGGSGLSALVLDLTEDPGTAAASPLLLGHRQAVSLGRSAADATRRGWTQRASALWETTETAWRAVGDERRARLAHQYAGGDLRRRRGGASSPFREQVSEAPPAPLLVDQLPPS